MLVLGGLSLSELQGGFGGAAQQGQVRVWWQQMAQGQQDSSAPRGLGWWEDVLRVNHILPGLGAGAGLCPGHRELPGQSPRPCTGQERWFGQREFLSMSFSCGNPELLWLSIKKSGA